MRNGTRFVKFAATLSLAAVCGMAFAETLTGEQATHNFVGKFPGKVESIEAKKSADGKDQYVIQVRSGIYNRIATVFAEDAMIDTIQYNLTDGRSWITRNEQLYTTTTVASRPASVSEASSEKMISESEARRIAKMSYPGEIIACEMKNSDNGSYYQVTIRNGVRTRMVDVPERGGTVSLVHFQ